MKDSSSNSGRGEIKRLTADILRKYHQGKLSTRDMHLVEKMLLDDPFAAEALEGMELLYDSSGFESIESELNTQLTRHSKREKAKIIPIYQRPWNIAAAIALLLAASLFLFNLPNLQHRAQKALLLLRNRRCLKHPRMERIKISKKRRKTHP